MSNETKNNHCKEGAESERPQQHVIPKQGSYLAKDTAQFYMTDPQFVRHAEQKEAPGHLDPSTDVNMEATINPDDVLRAGGFGARDDLSSFLPIASDSTDFEASLLDAREYEEPQGEQRRPGLGWSEDKGPL
ncbi:1-acyl-sn-glycerol-3-phosphate acyltransferase 1 chloroplastic [Bienertia sinuspersici]